MLIDLKTTKLTYLDLTNLNYNNTFIEKVSNTQANIQILLIVPNSLLN